MKFLCIPLILFLLFAALKLANLLPLSWLWVSLIPILVPLFPFFAFGFAYGVLILALALVIRFSPLKDNE